MILHAATIALSAFLLFLVQPIVARQILPWFGGSAAVWTTCMVFFQVTLLAGYLYSDRLVRRLAPRAQAIVHTALLLASLAFLPITVSDGFKPTDADQPIGRILLLLAVTIGLPYLMLATTGPLVQAWFSRQFRSARVYRLYALSNLASMLALVGYPPLIEPHASGRLQSVGWSLGYGLFVLLAIAAAWSGLRHGSHAAIDVSTGAPADAPIASRQEEGTAPGVGLQALWLVLAALGSVLLLAVTTHITQNVASIPFLWVLPLSIYLITFILCFDGRGWYRRALYVPLAAIGTMAMLGGLSWRPDGLLGIERSILDIGHAVPIYAFGLFVLCMFLHGELVARKPAPAHLTRFYLMISLGGALGGLLVGIGAPLAFAYYWELPVALLAVALLATALSRGGLRAVCLGATVLCALLLVDYVRFVRQDVIELSRNFYGTLRVTTYGEPGTRSERRQLLHGVILHGEQFVDPDSRALPTTYYGPTSGIGRTLDAARDGPMRVGLIGLGVGTLVTYGQAGDVYRLYELNPVVPDIARRHFGYLQDSAARIELALGDAGLVLEREPAQRFDVLAVDAFSSDAIPVHLVTREALAVYRQHLSYRGAVVFHISNRYLDLSGVIRQLADEAGLIAVQLVDDPPPDGPLQRSDWIAVTANPALADALRAAGGETPAAPPAGRRPWTDDHHNLFEILR